MLVSSPCLDFTKGCCNSEHLSCAQPGFLTFTTHNTFLNVWVYLFILPFLSEVSEGTVRIHYPRVQPVLTAVTLKCFFKAVFHRNTSIHEASVNEKRKWIIALSFRNLCTVGVMALFLFQICLSDYIISHTVSSDAGSRYSTDEPPFPLRVKWAHCIKLFTTDASWLMETPPAHYCISYPHGGRL